MISTLFFYENIAQHLLQNIDDNHYKYKANLLWCFPSNFDSFIVCEASYSYQFHYLIKQCPDDIRVKRKLIARRHKKKEPTIHIAYFHKHVHVLIFVDKSWFKVTNLLIFLSIHIFKSGLEASQYYESSKLNIKWVDTSA